MIFRGGGGGRIKKNEEVLKSKSIYYYIHKLFFFYPFYALFGKSTLDKPGGKELFNFEAFSASFTTSVYKY